MSKFKFWLSFFWLVLLFFCFFFTTAVAFETKFHCGVYDALRSPDGKRYPYFHKTKGDGFNCIAWWGFTLEDYDSASGDSLNLIDVYVWPGLGLYSKYEADRHNLRDYYQPYPGDQIRFLSTRWDHSGYGNQVEDPTASNGYAWFVSKDSVTHNRGLVLWELWHEQPDFDTSWGIDYSREMYRPNSWDGFGTELIYYARFSLKVPTTPDAQPLDTVAKLEVHFMNAARDSIVADSLLFYQDFDLGEYDTFELSFRKYIPNEHDSLDYRVFWFKKTDLFIDYVEIYDCIYDTLVNHKPIYQDRIIAQALPFENLYHGKSLFRWYLKDEPEYAQYKANREVSHFLDSLHYVSGVQAIGMTSWHNPRKFADEVLPHEICYDDYTIVWSFPEALQSRLNLLTWGIQQAAVAASDHNIEWWYVAPAFKNPDPLGRYPHNSELRSAVYLSLAYGAKGMEYYRYSSDPWWTPQNRSGESGLMWWNDADWVPIETYSGPNPYSTQPETLLTEVVRINFWLDSLGTTLRSLNWIGACLDSSYNNNDFLGCGGGYLDSIRSPGAEPHWVQVGFFENQSADTSYFMLVNRECLVIEGADFDVFVRKAGGHYQIRDVYTDQVVGNVMGTGDYFTIYLGPGEGKLLRLEEVPRIKHVPADYPTIQSAINATWDGDTVLVAPGIYYENINFLGKGITVASHFIYDHNPATIEATIIDGSQPSNPDSGSVVRFVSGEDSSACIKGFTLKKGIGTVQSPHYTPRWGGGVVCLGNSSPTIANNIIISNRVFGVGAGIFSQYESGSSPKIISNLIKGNYADYGGGICGGSPRSIIANNLIIQNTADWQGGGIEDARGIVANNTIDGNVVQAFPDGRGGGILAYPTCRIVNNIITNNQGGGGICFYARPDSTISYNDVWNNTGVNCAGSYGVYVDTTQRTNRNGTPCDSFYNIIQDPKFVNPSVDYHLQGSSGCINAGNNDAPGLPDFDFEGNPRIRDGYVDMGAYEYLSYVPGDANGDGKVSASDVVYLINYLFMQGPRPPNMNAGDANGDCKINASDIVCIINYLFMSGPPPVGCAG
jgi:hypothetical protein